MNTWDIIPSSQTSYTVDGYTTGAGYTIYAWPVNTLTFSDSAADFSIYIATEPFAANIAAAFITGSL